MDRLPDDFDADAAGRTTVDDAVHSVVNNPARFDDVIQGLDDSRDSVRSGCAKVAEEIAELEPHLLTPHKQRLLTAAEEADHPIVRGSIFRCLPHLPLDDAELQQTLYILESAVYSSQTFLVTQALAALSTLGSRHPSVYDQAADLLHSRTQDSNSFVAKRARRAISKLEPADQ